MFSIDMLNITRVEESHIVTEILKRTSSDIVSWKELLDLCKSFGISTNRLRKILLSLIEAKEIVELRCRLFTSPKLLRELPQDELEKKISEAIARSKLKKCGKPLTIPTKSSTINEIKDYY